MWCSRGLRIGVTALAVSLLAGCGFQPLYGKQAGGWSATSELAAVRIEPIPNRAGQLLHNELRDALNPHGQPLDARYRLVVRLRETVQELAIRKDETATRANLRLTASFDLKDGANGDVVNQGESLAIVSYNILDSEFATYAARNDARKRGISVLAQQIRTRIAGYLLAQHEAAAQ